MQIPKEARRAIERLAIEERGEDARRRKAERRRARRRAAERKRHRAALLAARRVITWAQEVAASAALDELLAGLPVYESRHWRVFVAADGALVVRHSGLYGYASGRRQVASAEELVKLAPVEVLAELDRRIAGGEVWAEVERIARVRDRGPSDAGGDTRRASPVREPAPPRGGSRSSGGRR